MRLLIHHQYLLIDNELYKDYLNIVSKDEIPIKTIGSIIIDRLGQINE